MKLPKTIRISHSSYELLPKHHINVTGDPVHGLIKYTEKEIEFVENLKGNETVDTIIHEIFHGIFRSTDLMFNQDGELEEHIVTVLATGLTTVMKDNPKLFLALQEMIV